MNESRAHDALRRAPLAISLEKGFSDMLANSMPGILYLFDPEGLLLWWNQNLERVTDYSADELAGMPLTQLVAANDRQLVMERFRQVMESGSTSLETRLVLKSGDVVPYHFTGHRVEFVGSPCLIGMGIDITERKRTECRRGVRLAVPQILAKAGTLREAGPRLLKAISECLGWDLGAIWTVDRVAGVLTCLDLWYTRAVNAEIFETASKRTTLAPGVGLPGRVWSTAKPAWVSDVAQDENFPRRASTVPSGLRSAFACPILAGAEVLGVVEFFSGEVREPDPDLLEMMSTVGGQIGQFMQRKDAEEELRGSEARKAAMLEAALDAIITIDHEENILEFNPAAEKIFGYPRAEVLGLKLSELIIPPTHREAHRKGLARFLATGEGPLLGRRVEVSALHSDGTEFPAEISIVPTVVEGKTIFTGYLRNITTRKRAEQEILKLNRDLEERVSQRTAELSAANAALERASQLKDQFLATISHELRTPLNGVIGTVDLLADTNLDVQQRSYAQVAQTSANLLLSVINDILDFSRIEAGKLELEAIDFNPAEVVQEVVSVLAMQADEKNLELSCEVEPAVDTCVSGDRGHLRQVLVNLAANAIKFTERGRVVLRAALEESADDHLRFRFTVSDTGIGIPNDRLERLFQPFSQIDATTTRRFGGSGLGLAISQRLVHLMDGHIQVDSTPGVGSTFWFTVRLALPTIQRDGASPCPPAKPMHHDSSAKFTLPGPTRCGWRVLVPEDNKANQLVVTALLRKLGHTVCLVENGLEAVAALDRERFDLVLMDLQMPDMDGLQATTEIRRREASSGAHTPIIGLTAHAIKGDRERCLAGGMDGYLTKPINRRELCQALESLLSPKLEQAESAESGVHTIADSADLINHQSILARLEGDEQLLRELIDVFQRDWPLLFAETQSALTKGDLKAIAFKAHRLNGLAKAFDADSAGAAAGKLEEMAKEGSLTGLAEQCATMEREFERLERALRGL